MLTVVVWIICSVACYFLAKQKARNETLWAVLGILFGVFSLVVLALLKPITGTGVFKKCPQCLSTIPQEASKCSHCQSEVSN